MTIEMHKVISRLALQFALANFAAFKEFVVDSSSDSWIMREHVRWCAENVWYPEDHLTKRMRALVERLETETWVAREPETKK